MLLWVEGLELHVCWHVFSCGASDCVAGGSMATICTRNMYGFSCIECR